MPNVYLLLAVAVLAFGAGWEVKGWQVGAAETQAANQALKGRAAEETVSARVDAQTGETLSHDRAIETEQQHTVEDTLAKHPDGYGCRIPADGLPLLQH
jgi:hypothetical protein